MSKFGVFGNFELCTKTVDNAYRAAQETWSEQQSSNSYVYTWYKGAKKNILMR